MVTSRIKNLPLLKVDMTWSINCYRLIDMESNITKLLNSKLYTYYKTLVTHYKLLLIQKK